MNSVALIEAILLIETEGVNLEHLEQVSGLSQEEIIAAIGELQGLYEAECRGIMLTEMQGKYKLVPKKPLLPYLKKYYNSTQPKLTRANLEVLAIIAYSQPITRSEIEELRGVSCDATIRKLLEQELIQEAGRKDTIGRPVQFGTTKHFLHCFNLESIKNLPELPLEEELKFQKI